MEHAFSKKKKKKERRRGGGGAAGFSKSVLSQADLFVGCLLNVPETCKGRIFSNNCTCCHTETKVAVQAFYVTQTRFTDTKPTSPALTLFTLRAWQGSPWSTKFYVTGMTRPGNIPQGKSGNQTQAFRSRDGRLTTRTRCCPPPPPHPSPHPPSHPTKKKKKKRR